MLENVHILIVEDSQTQASEIKYFLEQSGYNTSLCYDGVEAWNFLQKQKVPPSLVISDILMPKMNGYDLCEKIRQHEKFSDVMVMLLTALSEPTDIIKGLKSQADSFVIKPYNKSFLLGRIGHLLEYRNFIKQMPSDMGLAIDYFGQRHFLTNNRVQVIDNLLSLHNTVETQSKDLKRALEAEKKLKESEKRYHRFADNISETIWEVDLNTLQFNYVNPSSEHVSGFSDEEIKNSRIEDLFPPSSLKLITEALSEELTAEKSGLAKPRLLELEHLHKNGSTFWAEISARFVRDEKGRPYAVVGVTRDISDRKKSEAALKESEEKYRTILENIEDGYFEIDIAGNFTFYNQAMCSILGYKGDELIGKNNREYMDTKNAQDVYTVFNHVYNSGESYKALDWELIRKDGTICNVETSVSLLKDEKGKVLGFKGIARDITERKQSAKALQESEARYRLLADNVNDNIWIFDLQTLRFSYVSPSVSGISGFTSEEATGFQLEDTLTSSSLELANKVLEEELIAASQNFDPSRSRTLELEQYHKNGSTVWTEVVVKFIYDDKQQPKEILGVTRDISDRKKLQEKLYKSQKMESLGLLAGGVAHDLNNVLSGIVSYPELILMNLSEDSNLRKPLKTIMDSGNKAVAIVQDLLTIARGVAINKEPLKLNDLVSDYLNSPEFRGLRQYFPEVTFKTHLAEDLFNIEASNVHITKVIMNLVANAAEAVKENGNVSIKTENLYLDIPLNGYEEIIIGEYAVLTITDDGSGISSGDLERIFEPFYTKKKMGRSGTGLGLSVVWNVVRDHKGFIDVKTDEHGTKLDVYFPITHDSILKKADSLSIKKLQGSGEAILVVDDIESQREITCQMLDILGYNCDTASSGETAIEYLMQKPVDLVLLDMIMEPGKSGYETYKEIVNINPGQKAIILSGFSETDEVRKTQSLGAGKYLKKPVTLERLGLSIKEELKK